MADRYTLIEAHAPHPTRSDLRGRRLASVLLPARTHGVRNPEIDRAWRGLAERKLWRSRQTIEVDSVATDIFLLYVDHELEGGL